MPIEVKGKDEKALPQHHMIIRYVSEHPDPIKGSFSAADIDAYINQFLAQGWRVVASHYIGKAPEGMGFAWILVKE